MLLLGQIPEEKTMDVLATIKKWAAGIADVAVSLMAMFVALEILFGGSSHYHSYQ